jgi:hypothetical protein
MATKRKKVVSEKETGIRYLAYNIPENDAFVYRHLEDMLAGMCEDDFGEDGNWAAYKIQFLEEITPKSTTVWEPVTPLDLSVVV